MSHVVNSPNTYAALPNALIQIGRAWRVRPLFLIDLLRQRRRPGPLLGRYGMAALLLLLVAGWFYAANFHNLYYYYFIWNTAANENLPLDRSYAHLQILLGQNIG